MVAARDVTDDTGTTVAVRGRIARVVSLVPSLTEALEVSSPGLVAGATDWCTHPHDLDVARVGGTKNPDVDAVLALAPDLVVANEEENRATDLESLRSSGAVVWVTQVRYVDEGLLSLGRLLEVCGVGEPSWLGQARQVWSEPPQVRPGRRVRAVVPIWRRPWMALGHSTFAGDVLKRLGVDNVLAESPERYPRFSPDDLPEHDLVVLPDEPYAFTADDGPEALPHSDCALVSGRHLTWYGPSLTEAASVLVAQLRDVVPRRP